MASANAYQECGAWHPFTSESGRALVATPDGWVEEPGGPVVQEWAHGFMLDWGWKEELSPFHQLLQEIREARAKAGPTCVLEPPGRP